MNKKIEIILSVLTIFFATFPLVTIYFLKTFDEEIFEMMLMDYFMLISCIIWLIFEMVVRK